MKSWLEHLEEKEIGKVPLDTNISMEQWSEPLHPDYAMRTRLMLRAGVEFTWRENEYEEARKIAIQKLHRTLFGNMDRDLYMLYEAAARGSRQDAFVLIDKLLSQVIGRDIYE